MVEINWVIEDQLAGSVFPPTNEFERLYKKGIRAILSLEFRMDEKVIKGMGFKHKLIYIMDFTAPTLKQLEDACHFIDENINANRPVLVHCLVGQGRTGTVICAYLIFKGWNYEESLERVRSCIPYAVEVPVQQDILREFEKRQSKFPL